MALNELLDLRVCAQAIHPLFDSGLLDVSGGVRGKGAGLSLNDLDDVVSNRAVNDRADLARFEPECCVLHL